MTNKKQTNIMLELYVTKVALFMCGTVFLGIIGCNPYNDISRDTTNTGTILQSSSTTAATEAVVPVRALQNQTGVAVGQHHMLARDKDGNLWGWGDSGDSANQKLLKNFPGVISKPKKIVKYTDLENSAKVISVAAGISHSVILLDDGSIYTAGTNVSGQLGKRTTQGFHAIPKDTDIKVYRVEKSNGEKLSAKYIAAAGYHTFAIDKNGYLYGWGSNSKGQLGDNTTKNKSTPTKIQLSVNAKMSTDIVKTTLRISRILKPNRINQRTFKTENKTWRMVATSEDHTLAIDTEGFLWNWGGDLLFPMPVSAIYTSWRYVSAGNDHFVAIDENDDLYTWGDNSTGELGHGNTTKKSVPTKVGTDKWITASAGFNYTLAIKVKDNEKETERSKRTGGTLWVAGKENFGRTGNNSSGANSIKSFTPIATNKDDWTFVVAGDRNAIAIDNNGKVWTWGDNTWYQVGNDSNAQVNVPTNIKLTQ